MNLKVNSAEGEDLEKYLLTDEEKQKCVEYLRRCHNPDGGFAGAPFHQSHVASSYAAMLAIVNIGTEEAYSIVDREGMRKFLHSIKNQYKYQDPNQRSGWSMVDKAGEFLKPTKTSDVIASVPGSFIIHKNGEVDMRGAYCALVIADILDIMDDQLKEGVGNFIASC